MKILLLICMIHSYDELVWSGNSYEKAKEMYETYTAYGETTLYCYYEEN